MVGYNRYREQLHAPADTRLQAGDPDGRATHAITCRSSRPGVRRGFLWSRSITHVTKTCGRGLDRYLIGGLARLAAFVEGRTRPQPTRPLVVAGWSTGGLVAVRPSQEPFGGLSRPVNEVILVAPGLDVKLIVGDFLQTTEETLTHNPDPPHRGSITPDSPVKTPLFSADLLLNTRRARVATTLARFLPS